MTKNEFLDLIAFCILMQNNEGIISKAPRYVMEKFQNRGVHLLDPFNLAKFNEYAEAWERSIEGLPEE